MDGKWDRRFMELARHVAGWSKDPRTQVGAVLVGQDKRNVALGYNGFPPGIHDDGRLLDRETKHKMILHAERNVLDNAGFSAAGASLYTTKPICPGCAASVISLGVRRVVMPSCEDDAAWSTDAVLAQQMLTEAGVNIRKLRELE